MTRSLSASRLNDFLGCAHQSALWLAGVAPDEEVDETLQLIRAKGFEHEAAVLARLEAIHGPAVHIPTEGGMEARVAATQAAIASGAPLIYQGALVQTPWIGFPDFLIRKETPEKGVTYEPEDAKLARKAKPDYVLQLGIYADLLEASVGHPVANGVIHGSGDEPESFDLRQTRHILRRQMKTFEDFVASAERETVPVPCAACAQCDYQARCEAEWRAADSPYFVAGVSGAQVVKLREGGITTLAELAQALATTTIAGIGAPTFDKLRQQARLQLAARETGKHSVELLPLESGRGFFQLPEADSGDLYFDMEGDPLYEGGLEYLFGLWGPLGKDGADEFVPIWAHDPSAEKAAFEQLIRLFVAHLARFPNAHIYHYAQYEPNALKRLAMRYATMEVELDQLLRDRRFVDLYRIVRQGVRASTEAYSLKSLEQIYWGERSGEVTNAAASIVEYERWRVSQDQAILDSIAHYNRDDCVSTAQMHRWLVGLRPAGAGYRIADELGGDERDKAAERTALELRRQQIAAAVRASPAGNEAVREVVAELIWFHQRAQKPGWWALFERQLWSDEELIDDAESLGALELDTSVPAQADKQSLLRTFRFPPQDTKLKLGDTPRIAETLANAGTITALIPDQGRIVLRRGARAGDFPPRFGMLSAPISQQNLPVAVAAFAERFAASTLGADMALMDFLMRRPPRLRARTFGAPILAPGEDVVTGTTRAVLDLDASALFVQGPPGTGKTYTIGAVIVELLKRGLRVGVSSNSHKAINKVLEEVEEHAKRASLHFIGAKKGSKDDPDTHFDSAHITTVFKSEDVAAQHRLVGGTAFHFCRDDQQGQFDYLIVDEAGQVSLGNLVAMAGAARNLVLVGDQMQLAQPIQGVHPGETGMSALDYLLQGLATVPPERGILLNQSRRMRPEICGFISEAMYDGRLSSHPDAELREIVAAPGVHPAIRAAGIVFLQAPHQGNTQSSATEADAIAHLVAALGAQSVRRKNGKVTPLALADILVVAPYNMQVNLLRQRLPDDVKVGTIDKFQGQEAPVVILSMTTSRGEDAPRGTAFLFNRNRFNVAISRAQCLAIVVHSGELLEGSWRRIDDLRRLNLLAHAASIAAHAAHP
ncbi:MAG: TM0106 family RecB-like putative nuclease [Hyphomonadaceae bacterium]|nr:TM0106 family RecB-like putative nuclease [Hyphomonadaceae bacterium]